MELKLELQQDW